MTDHKNSNTSDEIGANGESSADHDAPVALDWEDFERDYRDDFQDLANSSVAKHFERRARRHERASKRNKQTEHDARNEQAEHDARDATRRQGNDRQKSVSPANLLHTAQTPGPRDFQTHWLDTDTIMDDLGDDFTPPNPDLHHIALSAWVFGIMLLLGIVGIMLSLLFPSGIAYISTLSATLMLIGGAGLILRR